MIRNQVKRRLREIFRLNRRLLGELPLDLVINVYGPGGKANSQVLKAEFGRVAQEVLRGKGRPGSKEAPRRRRISPAQKPPVAVGAGQGSRPSNGSRT